MRHLHYMRWIHREHPSCHLWMREAMVVDDLAQHAQPYTHWLRCRHSWVKSWLFADEEDEDEDEDLDFGHKVSMFDGRDNLHYRFDHDVHTHAIQDARLAFVFLEPGVDIDWVLICNVELDSSLSLDIYSRVRI